MKLIRILRFLIIAILLNSCNLDDFDMNKLSFTDMRPKVYTPLAYGTFNVSDYFSPIGSDADIINVAEIDLKAIDWDKGTLSFKTNALDSVFVVATITNNTPMKMRVRLDFMDYASKTIQGDPLESGEILPGTVLIDKKFPLDANDLSVIKNTDGLRCTVSLFPSGNAVTVKDLKESKFSIQVNFQSRIIPDKLN